jgi:uncharacterized protein YbbC (DUF1343 family)
MYCGIDLVPRERGRFAGKRVGLLTTAAGMNGRFESSVDVLRN